MTTGHPLGSKYFLEHRIGRGAMGEVWRASARLDGQAVAVKVLRPELADEPDIAARFFRERVILTGLAHPNLARVRDLVVEGETVAIVMDLVEGSDLRRLLVASGGTLAPADVARLLAQVVSALAAVHAAGVVHRDVKPENVLVDREGMARLTDFGIARLAEGPALTALTRLVGTPEYMAPELGEGEHATAAVDVYAVGIMAYELLAGATPFAGGHPMAVLRRHIDETAARPPAVPDVLWRVLSSCLAKDPGARPPAAVLASDLAAAVPLLAGLPAPAPFLAGHPTPVPTSPPATARSAPSSTSGSGFGQDHPTQLGRRARDPGPAEAPPAPGPAPPPWWRRRWALATAVLVVVLGVGGLVVALPGDGPPAETATFAFAPATYPSGLVVSRTWELTGDEATRFEGAVRLTNSTDAPMSGGHDEVIPKSVAEEVDDVEFRPIPDRIVARDPIVHYEVAALAPGASFEFRYTRELEGDEGSAKRRLRRLAADQVRAETAHAQTKPGPASPLKLASLVVEPAALSLSVGQRATVALKGTMSDGTPALPEALAGVAWASSNPEVAGVAASEVSAIAPGTSTLTAQAGDLRAQVVVTVRPAEVAQPSRPATPRTTAARRAPASPPPGPPTTLPPPQAVATTTTRPCEPGSGDTHATRFGDGELIRERSKPEVNVVYGWARLSVQNEQEFAAMGYKWENVKVVADGTFATISTIPRNGTLLRERSRQEIWVMLGGGRFWVPSIAEFTAMGYRAQDVRVVPNGSLAKIPAVPRNGTLLWPRGSPDIFVIRGGRRSVTTNVCRAQDVLAAPAGAADRFPPG